LESQGRIDFIDSSAAMPKFVQHEFATDEQGCQASKLATRVTGREMSDRVSGDDGGGLATCRAVNGSTDLRRKCLYTQIGKKP